MTPELAQQLKDAGFPYFVIHKREAHDSCPTLSELIEACGPGCFYIDRDGNGAWGALMKDTSIEDPAMDGVGVEGFATPEEAVANLWLALKKK